VDHVVGELAGKREDDRQILAAEPLATYAGRLEALAKALLDGQIARDHVT
jgi:hypothetical protein